MLPKKYFDDKLTRGVAYGTLQHIVKNRFTILKLPVGYGKTIISMIVAKQLALLSKNKVLQVAIIAPKAKRLDRSFDEAIESTEKYFGVKLKILPINGNTVGTFAGLNVMRKKDNEWKSFLDKLKSENTFLILDETHMQLRESTKTASKNFRMIFKELSKGNTWLKILGLTATPFDKSILDTVGYLILNGDYTSRTNFYNTEILNYSKAKSRGMTHKDFEDRIVDSHFAIHKEMFVDIQRVIEKLSGIIYSPNAPVNFHIPDNIFRDAKILLSDQGLVALNRIEKMDRQKLYTDNATKAVDYSKTLTTDPNILDGIGKIINAPITKQPLIFYQYNVTLDALKDYLTSQGRTFFQVNGHSQDYHEKNDNISPVLVHYKSGAAAFESKASNTSIYIELPASAIDYQQSLGRNTRRGQEIDRVFNYIIRPLKISDGKEMLVQYFANKYDRIVNKTIWNSKFEQVFTTQWGAFGEDDPKI